MAMDAKDFGQLLKEHPEMLDDSKKFAAILRDIYSSEKGNVNLMITSYNAGVVSILRGSDLDSLLISRIMTILMDDYNVAENKARWAAELWKGAYNIIMGNTDRDDSSGQVEQILQGKREVAISDISRAAISEADVSNDEAVAKFLLEAEQKNNYHVDKLGKLFSYNRDLKILHIPEFVKDIPDGAFSEYHDYGEYPYASDSQDGFFENNLNIEEVYIPPSIKRIPIRAFQNCKKLKKIVLSGEITEIGINAFCGCESLEKVVLPSTIKIIGEFAFSGCISIKEIVIPKNVYQIDGGAFGKCKNLHSVKIEEGTQELLITDKCIDPEGHRIRIATFGECDALENVEIGLRPNIISIFSSSLIHRRLKEVVIADEYKAEGYEIAIRDGCAELIRCQGADGTLITYIGNPATEILSLPEYVHKIRMESFAFGGEYRKTTVIYIGENIDSIEEGAFSPFCSIKEFQVHPLNQSYTAVSGVLFSKDMQTLVCYPVQKEDSTYIVPNGVTKIAKGAFRAGRKHLQNLFIPDNVTEITEDVVLSGIASIRNVHYPASFSKRA